MPMWRKFFSQIFMWAASQTWCCRASTAEELEVVLADETSPGRLGGPAEGAQGGPRAAPAAGPPLAAPPSKQLPRPTMRCFSSGNGVFSASKQQDSPPRSWPRSAGGRRRRGRRAAREQLKAAAAAARGRRAHTTARRGGGRARRRGRPRRSRRLFGAARGRSFTFMRAAREERGDVNNLIATRPMAAAAEHGGPRG